MPDAINFYNLTDEFGCFSNFARYSIQLDRKSWPTSEHYFQAQKFEDEGLREEVRSCKSPRMAANIGRDRTKPLRRDWETIKDDTMRKAVRAKFAQHEDIRAILLSTGDAKLVEHTKNDSYWGDGGDGSGKNMLGRILMEIRADMKGENAGSGR